ncbi:MAG: TIGR02206 family membrane protein [Clostridia bacterium]|nr:TIGR02206 family membrane protein [Clostridia bacterium]
MQQFFGPDFTGQPFKDLSGQHVVVLIVVAVASIAIYLSRERINIKGRYDIMRYSFAFILIIQEVLLNIWYVINDRWSLKYSLPLHLCGISVILCILLLLTQSYFIYEIVYFWGMGGALQAIITPDMGRYNYTHFRFYQFFIAHGMIVMTVLFFTFVKGYKPTLKSVAKAFIATNIYSAVIFPVNVITGGNYLFLRSKPASPSIMDFLGEWPWYIFWLEIVAIAIYIVLYVPFVISSIARRRKESRYWHM